MPRQLGKFLNCLGISRNAWFLQMPATYILKVLITIPKGIAPVKSYMNKLQKFFTVCLFLCIWFKYLSNFVLTKNWRPRQLPLLPQPCYSPAQNLTQKLKKKLNYCLFPPNIAFFPKIFIKFAGGEGLFSKFQGEGVAFKPPSNLSPCAHVPCVSKIVACKVKNIDAIIFGMFSYKQRIGYRLARSFSHIEN